MSHEPSWCGTCPVTRKRRYADRQTARAALRDGHNRSTQGLAAYRCPHCQYWEIGHLPPAVVAGDMARSEIRPPRQR